jgi:hypothetical protein
MARTRIVKPAAEPPPAEAPASPPAAVQAPPAEPGPIAPTTGRKRASAAPAPVLVNHAGESVRTGRKPPPGTPIRVLGENPGALAAAQALAEELANEPEFKLPFSSYPKPSEQLAAIVDTVIDQGEGIDLNAEFDALQKELEILDALTPQVVRAHINRVEKNAQRAHRLFVLAKAQFETYRTHAATALGAMRDTARIKLARDKAAGTHPKQVTDQDVDDTAAIIFPEQWSDITLRLKRTELTLKHLEAYASIWLRRSYSLAELNPRQ